VASLLATLQVFIINQKTKKKPGEKRKQCRAKAKKRKICYAWQFSILRPPTLSNVMYYPRRGEKKNKPSVQKARSIVFSYFSFLFLTFFSLFVGRALAKSEIFQTPSRVAFPEISAPSISRIFKMQIAIFFSFLQAAFLVCLQCHLCLSKQSSTNGERVAEEMGREEASSMQRRFAFALQMDLLLFGLLMYANPGKI